jgi:hypothetical protein
MSAIRFFLVIRTCKRDLNGNTYTYAHVTSARSGRTATFGATVASNARYALRLAGLDWSAVHYVEIDNLPIRAHMSELKRLMLREDHITPAFLAQLEMPE